MNILIIYGGKSCEHHILISKTDVFALLTILPHQNMQVHSSSNKLSFASEKNALQFAKASASKSM